MLGEEEEGDEKLVEVAAAAAVCPERSYCFFMSLWAGSQRITALLDNGADLTVIDKNEAMKRRLKLELLTKPVLLGTAIWR